MQIFGPTVKFFLKYLNIRMSPFAPVSVKFSPQQTTRNPVQTEGHLDLPDPSPGFRLDRSAPVDSHGCVVTNLNGF